MRAYEAIRISALWAVINQDNDNEAKLRHIFRWYSKTFHTPLHQVEELPIDDVLVAYYEEQFEDMEEDERTEEIQKATLTPEELEELEKRLEESDDEFLRQVEAEAEAEAKVALEKMEEDRIASIKPQQHRTVTHTEGAKRTNEVTEEIASQQSSLIKMVFDEKLDLDVDSTGGNLLDEELERVT